MNNRISDIILSQWKNNPGKVYLKSYHDNKAFTGKQAIDAVHKIANAFIQFGLKPQDKIGLYSQNLIEWTLVDIAANLANLITVPIFATSNALQTNVILEDAKVNVLFVGEQEQYDEACQISRYSDTTVIVFDENVKLKNDDSIHLANWLNQYNGDYSAELEQRKKSAKSTDTATLIYTSGTTGTPKGVILQNLQFTASLAYHNATYDFKKEYHSLAFLPLSHIFERGWTYLVLANGMQNVYLNSPKNIAEALEKVKPQTLCAVPRLYEKIYSKVIQTIENESTLKQRVFHWALRIGKNKVLKQQNNQSLNAIEKVKFKIADKLVFKKLRDKLGGNLVFTPCGGAYIPNEIVLFFHAVGIPILVGYGLTESTATVTSFTHDNFKIGTVGLPMNPIQIKIGENDEILVKGDTVTPGYYKRDVENQKSFTADGFFKTGDAGQFDKDGYLKITDRIKELIKTAGGKYIAPQLVESKLLQSPFIAQAIVVGEGKPYASALVYPDFEYLEIWAKKNNIPYESNKKIIENKKVQEVIHTSFKKTMKDLSTFEQVKKIKYIFDEFTIENDLLSPTLKLKRKKIVTKYTYLIKEIYHDK